MTSPDTDSRMTERIAHALERIGRLLAMMATKGTTQRDQVLFLKGAGYSNAEIAHIVGTTPHQVAVILHGARSTKTKRQAWKKSPRK